MFKITKQEINPDKTYNLTFVSVDKNGNEVIEDGKRQVLYITNVEFEIINKFGIKSEPENDISKIFFNDIEIQKIWSGADKLILNPYN